MNNKTNIAQIGLVILAIAAIFGIFYFGKTTPPKKAVESNNVSMQTIEAQQSNFNTDSLKNLAVQQLTEDELKSWQLINSGKDVTSKVEFWSEIDRNDIAAIYKEELAEIRNDFETWNSTGDSNVRAYRESADTANMLYFVNQAVYSYNKALAKDDVAETKIKLAKIHTDITGQVMNGVMLLRSIVEKDPNNVQANHELGILSLRSEQYDKAMPRFETIIKNDPRFIEAYLYKSQLLLKQGKKDEAILVLEQAIINARSIKEKEALQDIKNNIINN